MKEQGQIDNMSNYAARLAEERRRVCPHQGDFAKGIGITQGRQSLLEQGKRELRADYLDVVAQAGLDVRYIITGIRATESLAPDANELLSLYMGMPGDFQEGVLIHVRSMYGALARRGTVAPPPEPAPLPKGGVQERAGYTDARWVYEDSKKTSDGS